MKGHEGWDDYAAYYDWENAQTVGRRDIAFWQSDGGSRSKGPILEFGCGTGRVAIPVAKAARPSSASIDRRRCSRADEKSVRRARLGIAREVDPRRHPPSAVSR